jgi:hypothetical protein
MNDANSKLEDYSYRELMDTLAKLQEKFPAVYRWFLIWELEKMHGTRESDSGLGQEQEADSGSP